jgi:putative ABC transport system permease protein
VKYLPLLWAGLWRKPARTILTLLSIVTAFVLFGLLQGVNAGFNTYLEGGSNNRLITISRLSYIDLLPLAHRTQIASVPGVERVVMVMYFGGYLKDPKEQIGSQATEPVLFDIVTDFHLPAEQRKAWERTPTGAVVGRALAQKYGWKLGDRVPLNSSIWPNKDGTRTWQLDISGIYEGPSTQSENALYFHFDYFNEASARPQKDTAGYFYVGIKDPKRATQIARSIDALFANSQNETKTQSEQEFVRVMLRQLGDINLLVNAIVGAVLFTLLFLTANTMMQSVRERIPELAVLKTVGFSDHSVLLFVLCEGLLLRLIAAAIGLSLAALAFPAIGNIVGIPRLGLGVVLSGLGIAALLALLSGLPPAWRAQRLKVVDALAGRA